MDPACAGDCARMMAPWCSDGTMASPAPGDPGGFLGLRRARASTRQRPSRGSKPLAWRHRNVICLHCVFFWSQIMDRWRQKRFWGTLSLSWWMVIFTSKAFHFSIGCEFKPSSQDLLGHFVATVSLRGSSLHPNESGSYWWNPGHNILISWIILISIIIWCFYAFLRYQRPLRLESNAWNLIMESKMVRRNLQRRSMA
jgi:hypothetical protein